MSKESVIEAEVVVTGDVLAAKALADENAIGGAKVVAGRALQAQGLALEHAGQQEGDKAA